MSYVVTCYVFRLIWVRITCHVVHGIYYTLRLTWSVRFEANVLHVVMRYVLCEYVLRGYVSTCHMDIPIRLPPARFVSRSVCVSEKVLLFGIENKK